MLRAAETARIRSNVARKALQCTAVRLRLPAKVRESWLAVDANRHTIDSRLRFKKASQTKSVFCWLMPKAKSQPIHLLSIFTVGTDGSFLHCDVTRFS